MALELVGLVHLSAQEPISFLGIACGALVKDGIAYCPYFWSLLI